jgi:NTP pyrophosphatase (non-canonical NTP hydrolase)
LLRNSVHYLKHSPFVLSLSKRLNALRQAQDERYNVLLRSNSILFGFTEKSENLQNEWIVLMTFEELQKGIIKVAERYGERYEIPIDQDFALLKLYEEVGEYAQTVLIHRKQSRPEKHTQEKESRKMLAYELADIVGLAVLNAHLFEVDLQQALEEKWLSKIAE